MCAPNLEKFGAFLRLSGIFTAVAIWASFVIFVLGVDHLFNANTRCTAIVPNTDEAVCKLNRYPISNKNKVTLYEVCQKGYNLSKNYPEGQPPGREKKERKSMPSITEERIALLAPNAAAVANARKISRSGEFTELCKTEDETLLFGTCKGSGANPYSVSADFQNPDNPVFRCSCPSRQFPCKHGLALIFEYLAGKNFQTALLPEDIKAKREKQGAKKDAVKSDAPKKMNKAAAAKKMQKQLEGLDLAEQFLKDVLQAGLATLGASSIKAYKDLSKQLGDYYLPGPQAVVNALLIELERFHVDPSREEGCYTQMITLLEELGSTIKKGRVFLRNKTESGAVEMEDSTLYNHIGYIWQLSQLKELGLVKERRELVQLSFSITYDQAREEYIDRGWWVDLETGEISKTENLRPLKAVKHIRQQDTVFDCVVTPCLYYYPGEKNKRIRWEECSTRALSTADYQAIRSSASSDFAALVKEAKNQIKNALSEKTVVCLLRFDQIGRIGKRFCVTDPNGLALELLCPEGEEDSVSRLTSLPDETMLSGQVLTGELYYDSAERRISVKPLSIVTDGQIVRLLY